MKSLGKFLFRALIFVAAVWLVLFLWPRTLGKLFDKPAKDEAMLAGKTPADFPQSADSFFHDMDGSGSLTPEEEMGRNTWLVWTGGNEAFWDYLTNHSFGTFDLLKALSSYPCSTEQEERARRYEQDRFTPSLPDPALAKSYGRYGYGAASYAEGSTDAAYSSASYGVESAAGGAGYGAGGYETGYSGYESVCADTMYPRTDASGTPLPYYRNYRRDSRFCYLGLMNEPGFQKPTKPDKWGLCLDERTHSEDPFDEAVYGRPTGVLGLRLYDNPNFDAKAQERWEEAMKTDSFYLEPSFFSSSDLVRPFRVGMSCAFCHVSHHPANPPDDPENPQFANLSGTIGAQYFWFGRIFGPNVGPENYVYHLLASQQPGAVDTSFVPTDYILNPRAMNAVFDVAVRAGEVANRFHQETSTGGALDLPEVADKGPTFGVPMILWDGSDSVGVDAALTRVYINIGEYHQEWIRHITPLVGLKKQSPITVKAAQENSTYWNSTQERAENLAAYLIKAGDPSFNPMYLDHETPAGDAEAEAYAEQLDRGKVVFAETCARCHSSKIPKPAKRFDDPSCGGAGYRDCFDEYWNWTETEDFKSQMREIVMKDDFLEDNYLSTDARIPVDVLETEVCSAMASNAIEGHIWDNFSSETYKSLPSVGNLEVYAPIRLDDALEPRPWPTEGGGMDGAKLPAPAGGRGYQHVPSLVHIWSTAPYLHNNEIGWFTNDPSTEGRLVAFDHGMRELLWPERRGTTVHRTDRVTNLSIQTSALPGALSGLVESNLVQKLLRLVGLGHLAGEGTLEIGPIPAGTPVSLISNINIDRTDPRVNTKEMVGLLLAIQKKLKEVGNTDDPVAVWTDPDFLRRLIDASTCPDFVVDRGHEFGADRSDDDKEALIAFVKTF